MPGRSSAYTVYCCWTSGMPRRMWGTEDRDHDADAEHGSDLAAHVHDRASGGGAVRGEGAGGRAHDLWEGETDARATEDERGEDLGAVAGCESERGERQYDARG